ncbi:tetratricopeptide repeat protein [Piscirickettsia salmonis]|nr:tetratricopeptide repeat protein [Piscirickettsia salmonis]QIX55663.1 sel1 repeat family protein [Piscirickettsia salmonis]
MASISALLVGCSTITKISNSVNPVQKQKKLRNSDSDKEKKSQVNTIPLAPVTLYLTKNDHNNQAPYIKTFQYMTPVYTSKKPSLTISKIRFAATTGDPIAELQLGTLYHDGYWLKKNQQHAFFWFYQAALNQVATAQYRLGLAYLHGKGVIQNTVTAFAWFQLAANHELPQSQQKIDQLIARLSPKQLQNAAKTINDIKSKIAGLNNKKTKQRYQLHALNKKNAGII